MKKQAKQLTSTMFVSVRRRELKFILNSIEHNYNGVRLRKET